MSYAIVTVIILILDQLVKFWTTKNVVLDAVGDECARLIPGLVHITNVHNYGAAFSILQNARWLLVVVVAVFAVAVILLITREIIRGELGQWMLVLVMAGAVGNGIDRALYGYVVDMFELEFMRFAVFNVADIFIVVGGIAFCLYILLHKETEEEKAGSRAGFRVRDRRPREELDYEKPVVQNRVRSQSAYDNIPKRGVHRTLEEELASVNPNDPFAEWEYSPVEEEKEPVAVQMDMFDTETKFRPSEEPSDSTESKMESSDFSLDFSLDDILSEFGDI